MAKHRPVLSSWDAVWTLSGRAATTLLLLSALLLMGSLLLKLWRLLVGCATGADTTWLDTEEERAVLPEVWTLLLGFTPTFMLVYVCFFQFNLNTCKEGKYLLNMIRWNP